MSLQNGAISCTRLNIISKPVIVDFSPFEFKELQPGSAIRERAGFLPYELGEEYLIGHEKWGFRVRMDKVTPDSTLLKERYRALLKTEEEQVGPPSPKVKKDLRKLAEDEILSKTLPRCQIVECLIENGIVYIGSTSNNHLDIITGLLKKIEIEVEYKAPWIDLGQDMDSPLVSTNNPGESVLGCHFLKKLIDLPEVLVEPEKGSVKLITSEGVRIGAGGYVLGELNRFLDEGAEPLTAKLIIGETTLTLVAKSFQIKGMKAERAQGDHWTEILDERMDPVREMWAYLDEKYRDLMVEQTE